MENPFAAYGHRASGDRLAGRGELVELFTRRLLYTPGSFALIGVQRIGKSSLVKEVACRVQAADGAIPVVDLNLGTITNPAQIFQQTLDDVVEALQVRRVALPARLDDVRRLPAATEYDAYYRCKRGLKLLHAEAGTRATLILDDFDAVRDLPSPDTVIQHIRDLIEDPGLTGLSAVIVARRSLRALEGQVRGSTLVGVCEVRYLKPLTREGLQAMAGRGAPDWRPAPEEEEALWGAVGGHPFLAEMVLCHAWDARDLKAGLAEAASAVFETYDKVRELLNEQELFDQLIQIAVGPRWSVRPGAIEQLFQYGLIREAQVGKERQYCGWSEHFQRYLERCSREAPIWAEWAETERGLRNFIEDVCLAQYGAEWMTMLAARHKSVATMVEVATLMREKDRSNFGPAASDRLLDFTYPMNLWEVLSAEWALFEPRLGKSRSHWNTRFTLLAKVRTPAAHNRDIPEADLLAAQSYCKELLAALRNVQN